MGGYDEPLMQLEDGKTPYSENTFDCDYSGCIYQASGRCVYNVSKIKSRISKACYEELVEAENESYLDYLDDLRKSEI